MSYTNLMTIALDSILDEVTCSGKCAPTVVELGNQRLKNNKSRAKTVSYTHLTLPTKA